MKILLLVVGLFLSLVARADFVPIVMYHKIGTNPSATEISLQQFQSHLDLLNQNGYSTITVSALQKIISSGKPVPEKTVVITFDDGWASSLLALKALKDRGMTATFYISTGLLGTPGYMTFDDVKKIADVVEIGAHTHTHFIEWESNLDSIDDRVIVGEMVLSKYLLEKNLGKEVKSFSWPYGYYREHLLLMSPSIGFASTVHANAQTKNSNSTNTLRLERINIHGLCTTSHFKRMIGTGITEDCK